MKLWAVLIPDIFELALCGALLLLQLVDLIADRSCLLVFCVLTQLRGNLLLCGAMAVDRINVIAYGSVKSCDVLNPDIHRALQTIRMPILKVNHLKHTARFNRVDPLLKVQRGPSIQGTRVGARSI